MISVDVIIPATEKNIETLRVTIPYVKKYVSVGDIYILANERHKEIIETIPDIIFFDENEVFAGLNFKNVSDIIHSITEKKVRTGWYLQQFLKLAWAYRCSGKNYISFDADTFALNPISYISNDGKYIFTEKVEYNEPYFSTINNLFSGGIEKKVDFSFIAENMIFDCAIVKEMIDDIMRNTELEGNTFYEKILRAVGAENLSVSGFSEFETYGNYIYTRYPDKVTSRKLRTLREGVSMFEGIPTDEMLEWASHDFDVMSIESANHGKTAVTMLTSNSVFRKIVSLRTIVNCRKTVRSLYRRLIGKKDFIFD